MAQNINGQDSHRIPRRILNSVIVSLASGVVPRVGAPYIAIGRQREIGALVSDLSVVSEGGSAMRFLFSLCVV